MRNPEQAATVPPPLAEGEIHLWQMDLAGDRPRNCERILDEIELLRASRLVFEDGRNRFLRCRYGLRSLLAHYLGMAPRDIAFAMNPHGKPQLNPALGLGFSLSRSGNLGLVAVGRAVHIGVDIEVLSEPKDMRDLAYSLFTIEERRSLSAIGDSRQAIVAFLTCWTRKEAYLKALGVGLSVDPGSFQVGIAADRSRVPIAGRPASEFVEVTSVPGDNRYIAALAVEGGQAKAQLFHWEWSSSLG